MKKLVLFGDSLFGRVGKDRIISLESTLKGYDVYNCAAGGWDTDDCAKKAPYIAKLEPDVLVISLGTNDAAPWKQIPIDTFGKNIEKILDAFPSSKIVFFLPPPVNENKAPDKNMRRINKTVKQYHDLAKNICLERGVSIIDAWKIFKPMLDNGNDYHVEDGVHIDENAYNIIGTELANLL